MINRNAFIVLLTVALTACGGSSDNNQNQPTTTQAPPNPSTEQGSTATPVVAIQHELKLGAVNQFLPREYTRIPITEEYEGTYWMIVRAAYSVDRSYFEEVTDVKDVFRSIIHIIKGDVNQYWMVQPWYDDVGTIYPLYVDDTTSGHEISTKLNVYGGEVLLRTYSIENDFMKARIETNPVSDYDYEITDSQIDFIKIADSPRLSGVWKDNQTGLGLASWQQLDQAADNQYAYNPIPLHLFMHGYQSAVTTNYDGDLARTELVEYLQVGSIIENLQSRVEDITYPYTDGVGYTVTTSLADEIDDRLLNRIFRVGATIYDFYSYQPYNIDIRQQTASFVNEFTNIAIDTENPENVSDKTIRVNIEFNTEN